MQIDAATTENSIEIPQKTENRTTISSSYPTVEYLSKDHENTNRYRYIHTYVHCGIIHNSQDLEITLVPIKGQMDKEDVVYVHNGILLSHKKDEILPFATWIKLEGIVLMELDISHRIC